VTSRDEIPGREMMHDHNGHDCGDDHDDDDCGGVEGEIEIRFEPRPEALQLRGISEERFEEALYEALDAYEAQVEAAEDEESVPELEDIDLLIDGESYRLGDLADISIAMGDDADEDEAD
jgi:hypothetical protein